MSQIQCPKCAANLESPGRFCSECGAPLPKVATATAKSPKPAGNTGKRDLLIVIVALAVIVGGYSIFVGFPTTAPPPAEVDSPHGDGMGGAMPEMPTDYAGLVTMGNNTMDQSNFPLAAECYRRALVIDGSSADVRTDFGACLHGMGLPERAIQEFQTVVAEHPEHPIAVFNLGIVYYTMSKPDSAITYFKRYISVTPTGSQADAARQYIEELETAKKES